VRNNKILTGRIRHRRTTFFDHLVLQVEEKKIVKISESVTVTAVCYRDATMHDFNQLAGGNNCPNRKTKLNLDKDDPWLTGNVRHTQALFSDRMILLVEMTECLLTDAKEYYTRAKSINLERGIARD
jgi:hypothetical protein